ncbi:MAG: glycosyltransferase family 29 protein [Ignavibacteriae bacterium]|nr:glycosyltransferase family 29 protein [Ignavibacteriota bacterium]
MSTAPITNKLHTARVAEAFDTVAESFETVLENDITRSIRQKVYTVIASLVPAGSTILDINCGIGIDAVELAQKGYGVVGTDISPQMIQQARLRVTKYSLQNVSFYETSFESLAPVHSKTIDLVMSNFGGLNCVPSLEKVAEQLTAITNPGSYFLAVVMPPFSLWEFLAGLLKLDFQFAVRRLKANVQATGFGNNTFTVSYFSPRTFAKAFDRGFEVVRIQGFNIISAPPHATSFVKHFPRLAKWLERVEQSIASLPLVRALGDHYMIVMRRRRSPKHPNDHTPSITLEPAAVLREIKNIRSSAKELDDDINFSHFVNGKRVALVGPARTLIGKRLGALIDSYDIVVRINDAFEYLGVRELLPDVGERTDILYANQVIIRKNILGEEKLPLNMFYKGTGVGQRKFLVCTNNSLNYDSTGEPSAACPRHDRTVVSDIRKLIARDESSLDFRLVYRASKFLIRSLNGNFPRTGLVALADLLSFDIDHLFVAGMTFYHGGGHLLTKETTRLHPLKNRDGSWAHDNTGRGHNSYDELYIMRILKQAFPDKLRVDNDLLELLTTNETTIST